MDTQGYTGQRGPEGTGAVALATFFEAPSLCTEPSQGREKLTSVASGATLVLRQ